MKIAAAPRVNLDTISALDSNKRYFLSTTTGEIKEASIFMRIKCAFGVSSALAKVSNLVEAVKNTLLENAGKTADAVLDSDIRTINVRDDIKGDVLKGIAGRFRQANSEAMIRKDAEREARKAAVQGFLYLNRVNLTCGAEGDIVPIYQHAFKAPVSGKLPTETDKNGRIVLDTAAFSKQLTAVREETTQLLRTICDDPRFKNPMIDRHFAQHIITTFFMEDGSRSDNAISDLLTPDEAFAANLFNLDHHNGTINSAIHTYLAEKGRDPTAYAKWIRGLCGGDKDLEAIVEVGLRNICATGGNKLRSDEAVAAKIAAIKDNLAEAREVEGRFPGFLPEFREAMCNLAGGALPKGAITRMAAAAAQADLSKLSKLNSFSGPGAILAAIDQLRIATDKHANPWKIFDDVPEMQGEIMPGGPEQAACRQMFQALAITKAGPAARIGIANAVRGTAYRKAALILSERLEEAKSSAIFPREKERDIRKQLYRSEIQAQDELYLLFFPPEKRPSAEVDFSDLTWEEAVENLDENFDEVVAPYIADALAKPDD